MFLFSQKNFLLSREHFYSNIEYYPAKNISKYSQKHHFINEYCT